MTTPPVQFEYAEYVGGAAIRPFGDTTTYERGLGWLDEVCETIEDWGAGLAWGRQYVKKAQYKAIDHSPSSAKFVDEVSPLDVWQSDPDGIFMRHVLEHNWGWRDILENALVSFAKRMVLVTFTPFSAGDSFPNRPAGDPYLDLSINRTELTDMMGTLLVRDEQLATDTQYRQEHMFFLSRESA